LQQGCLLLFDWGYFSFIFFDTLTGWGQWWISRYREGTVYQIVHPFYRHNDVLDALVWLGSSQHQCAHLVRLVRFGDGKQIRMYLSNVTDPHTLPLVAISQLYARRWDIELAFRLLKEYLGLSHWWSCKPELVKVPIWVVLILSQVVMGLRSHLAQAIRCDPFDLSLPLLLEHLPSWSGKPASLLDLLQTQGRQLGILRPQTHLSLALHLPVVPVAQYLPAPSDLPRHRPPRYRPYVPRKHAPSPSGYKNRSEKDRSIRELKAERRAQARQQKQAQNAP
jgi:Transposase DDE domain